MISPPQTIDLNLRITSGINIIYLPAPSPEIIYLPAPLPKIIYIYPTIQAYMNLLPTPKSYLALPDPRIDVNLGVTPGINIIYLPAPFPEIIYLPPLLPKIIFIYPSPQASMNLLPAPKSYLSLPNRKQLLQIAAPLSFGCLRLKAPLEALNIIYVLPKVFYMDQPLSSVGNDKPGIGGALKDFFVGSYQPSLAEMAVIRLLYDLNRYMTKVGACLYP